MKKTIKGFVLGIIITTILMSTAFGARVKKTIEVIYNSVNITVNGEKVNTDNILYEGTTYVPLRAVSELLGKEVGWDGPSNTASINDKNQEKPVEKPVKDTDNPVKEVNIGKTVTKDGLSVTIEEIEYNGDNFSPSFAPGSSYSKGFGVYYKVVNNSDKVYETPRMRFKLESPQYEKELNTIGYSMHTIEGNSGSSYIYPNETLIEVYQYMFERDVNITELEALMQEQDNYSPEALGRWLVK